MAMARSLLKHQQKARTLRADAIATRDCGAVAVRAIEREAAAAGARIADTRRMYRVIELIRRAVAAECRRLESRADRLEG